MNKRKTITGLDRSRKLATTHLHKMENSEENSLQQAMYQIQSRLIKLIKELKWKKT